MKIKLDKLRIWKKSFDRQGKPEQTHKNRKAYDRRRHNPKINPHKVIKGETEE